MLALSATASGRRTAPPQETCPLSAEWGPDAPVPERGNNFVRIERNRAAWNGRPVSDATLRTYVKRVNAPAPTPSLRPTLTLYRRGASCAAVQRIAAAIEAVGDCKPGICLVSDGEPPATVGAVPPPTPKDRSRPLRPLQNPGSWVTNDDYPPAALRAGEEGTAAFTLDVDDKGMVTGCVVTSSAQSPWLDDATCRLLKARARFVPALDASGTPIPAQYRNRFRWEIPPHPSVPLASWTLELRYVIEPGGAVQSCRVTAYGAGSEEMKAAACPWITSRPREALDKLRGSARGRVTIVLRSEHAVSGVPLPLVPVLPAAFKRVSVLKSRLEIGGDGVPTACYQDLGQGETMAPAANCRAMVKYEASDAAHTVRGISTVFTDGDPDIAEALEALSSTPPQP